MANEQNLMTAEELNSRVTPEERARNARKAGEASGEARRAKKTAKECAELILALPVSDLRKWNRLSRDGIDPEDINNMMLMVSAAIKAAQAGDMVAFREVLKLIGQDKPDGTDTEVLKKAREILGDTNSAID